MGRNENQTVSTSSPLPPGPQHTHTLEFRFCHLSKVWMQQFDGFYGFPLWDPGSIFSPIKPCES